MTTPIDSTKERAFTAPPETIAGLRLRPLTAGTLAILRQTKNGLFLGEGKSSNLEFDVAAFLYVHAGNAADVRKSAWDPEQFRERVLIFAEDLSIPAFQGAAGSIQRIIERALAGQDYEVEATNEGARPN